MPTFRYQAFAANGRAVRGEAEASTAAELIRIHQVIRGMLERHQAGTFHIDDKGQPHRLLDHVKAIQFQYSGETEDSGAKVWQPRWNRCPWLPELIRRVEIQRDAPVAQDCDVLTIPTHIDVTRHVAGVHNVAFSQLHLTAGPLPGIPSTTPLPLRGPAWD